MRFAIRMAMVVLVFAATVAAALAIASEDRAVPKSRDEIQLSFAPLVKKTAPAVVNIYSQKVVRTQSSISRLFEDPLFQRFFGEGLGIEPELGRKRVQNSLGSGVIVRGDGLIVTNRHVIEGADQVTVVLSDRREFDAQVVGSDERTDLAVLRVDARSDPLPFLEIRDSDDLEVGDMVLAIGNPFGVGQTVTSGIVSALARTGIGITNLNFFIQTDAAINPGNSGGALVAMDGRLVGINTAIFSKTGASHGIGFATPSNMVRTVMAGITERGRVVRPWLGATGQAVTAEIAQSLGLRRPAGVLVNDIVRGSPADEAGMKVGDVILKIAGQEVDDPEAVKYRIATLPLGSSAEFLLFRHGRSLTVTAMMMEPPEVPARNATELQGRQPLAGAVVANMSPALAEELGLADVPPGVVVLSLRRGSNAARVGIEPGDMVRGINGETVESVRHLIALMNRSEEQWKIVLRRGNTTLNLVVNR